MAVVKSSTQVSLNESYVERIEERTKHIKIDIILGKPPRVTIVREQVTYHDDVVFSSKISKVFEITPEDLISVNKAGIYQEIADAIDAISLKK